MANKIQIKRTSSTGVLPNTTNSSNTSYIAAGELAINLTDEKMVSSNGSATFEIGANLVNLSVTNSATINEKLSIGPEGLGYDFGAIALVEADGNKNSYLQIVMQNANTGEFVSSDVVVVADDGTDTTNYADFGINGSNYAAPEFGISQPYDAYLYSSDGNLTLGSLAAKDIIFHSSGANAVHELARFTTAGELRLGNSSVNTSITDTGIITSDLEVRDVATINTNSITIGNSSVNTVISASILDIGGEVQANGSVGSAGQVLKSAGSGANAYWSTVTGGSGTPGGTNTQVQFNDSDTFGGDAGLTYNKTTDALTVAGSVLVGANVIANTSALLVGNSSVNAVLTQSSFDIDGTIAAGNTTLVGFINVSSTANVGGAVNLRSTLAVNGAVTVPNTAALGNTTITGFINVSSTANVGGATNLRGDATVNGALTVANTAALGNTTITGFANVTSTIQGGAGLTIAGAASGITTLAAGNTTLTGFINVSSTANVGGATNLRGDATVNGALTVANTAALGNTTVTGFINVSSTANVGGAVNLRNTLAVNGAVTVSNTAALGNTTITGFANVTSTIQGGAGLTIAGAASGITTLAAGNTTITGFANVSGTANVGGATTLRSTLVVNGAITVPNTASFGNTTITGFANVSGAVFSGAEITGATQLATKQYVDSAVSAGIHVHESVRLETAAAIPSVTYTQGGTTPTITAITTNDTLTSVGHGLSVGDIIVFGSTTNGLTAGTAYVVESVATDTFKVSLSYIGAPVTSLTNGTGLSITSRANAGVGAKLTNAGTQAALVIDGITAAHLDRVTVRLQANAAQNGIYFVSNTGSISTNWELTRTSDANKYGPTDPNNLGGGDYFYTREGDVMTGDSHVLSTEGIIIFGTTNLVFNDFYKTVPYSGVAPINVSSTNISFVLPSASNTEVQFNDSATINSSAAFTFNKTSNTLTVSNTIQATNKLRVGTPGGYDFGVVALIEQDGNSNTYLQTIIQNANTGNNASSELVVTADSGNDSVNFASFGINGSNYNQAAFNIGGALDAFVYSSNSNIQIGTAANNGAIVFHANGTTSADEMARINTTGLIVSKTIQANAITIGANLSLNTSGYFVGNSTVNTTQTSSLIQVSNSTSTANLNAAALTIGSAVVNSTILTIGTGNFSTSANVGANVQLSTSTVFVGNTTVNASHTSALIQVANSTSTANLTAAGMTIGTIVANTTGLFVGSNVHANSSSVDVGNTIIASALLTLGGQLNANGGVGTAGQVLKSGATGNVYWDTASAGGTPGGANTEIQFNDSGAFGGSAALIFNKSTNTVVVSNTLQVTNKLQVGPATGFDFSAVAELVVDGNTNTYLQSVTQNSNTGNNASSEFVATADSGNDSVNFVSFGINGSAYNQAAFNIGGALDAYLYTSNSDLTIGTAANNGAIIFHANGTTATDEVARITTTGLRVGNATVNVAISATDITENGVSIVPFGRQTIYVPATAMSPQLTSGALANTYETAVGTNLINTFDFDATTSEAVSFSFVSPTSWNQTLLQAQFFWSHPTTTTNFGVAWGIAMMGSGDGNSLGGNFDADVVVTDTGGTANTLYVTAISGDITTTSGTNDNRYIVVRIQRLPANGSDTLAVDAKLHGVKIFYNTNAAVDD